jgi:O-antigen ligase
MRGLLSVLPLLLLALIFCRRRGIKAFLIFASVFFLPFRTDFLLMGGGVGESNWTDGLYITFSEVSLLLLFAHLFFSNQKIRRIAIGDLVPPIALVAACALSIVNSTWRIASVYQIIMLSLTAFLYFGILSKSLTTPDDIDILLIAFMASLTFQSALSILQYTVGNTFDFFSTGQSQWGGGPNLWGRGFGTVINRPNGFAALINPLLFLSVSILLGTERHRKLALVASVMGFLGLAASFSRGAWIGFAIGSIILVTILYKDGLLDTARLWKVLAVGALTLALLFPYLRARIVDDFMNSAMVSRIPLMIAALRMVKGHPIMGVGVNTFRSIIRSYVGGLDVFYLDETHNQYLLMVSEAGILGLAGWLWTMGRIFKNSASCFRDGRDRVTKYIGLGILTGFLSSSLHMFFDMYNSQVLLANMFVLLSLVAACNALGRVSLPGEQEWGSRIAIHAR